MRCAAEAVSARQPPDLDPDVLVPQLASTLLSNARHFRWLGHVTVDNASLSCVII